ncbi:putative Ig domain-containing protein [Desulfobacterales bacterium HSG2]|nr:putative Ig domain-containing protein [Desulfobacterales bacterium HSG2]
MIGYNTSSRDMSKAEKERVSGSGFQVSLLSNIILGFLFLFPHAGQVFGAEAVRTLPGAEVILPVTLEQETAIKNIDITITGYDNDLLDATEITLTGGVLTDKSYVLTENTSVEDQINLVIYATGDLVTAQGDVVFINLTIQPGEEGQETTLSVTKFECNDQPANGGFRINDTVSQDVNISINYTPVADDSRLETDEDSPLSGSLTASDADEDPLTFTIVAQPGKGSVEIADADIGAFTYTPNANENGTDTFTYQVSDGLSDSDIATVTVEISSVNDGPKFTSTAVTAVEQDAVYAYAIIAEDIDADDTLAITATTLPDWLTLTDKKDGTATLTGTPANAHVGDHSVTLQVKDAAEASDIQSFSINVANINDRPSFTSTDITQATEDETYTHTITTADPDIGDTLAITGLSVPDWLTLTDNADGTATLTGTPVNSDAGEHDIQVQVSDVAGATDTASFTISVANTNDAPGFTGTAVTAATEDAAYTYTITTEDPDTGDTRTLTAPTLPNWLTLTDNGDGTGRLEGMPANENVGDHPVELQTRDAAGATDTQSFTITVANVNDAPDFTGTPVTAATEDTAYTYTITTADPDAGDTRTVTATSLPDWLTFTDNRDGTGRLEGTPANEHVGDHSVALHVEDAAGATGTDEFSVTVSNVNDPPSFTGEVVTAAPEDQVYRYSITTADPDAGDTRSIIAMKKPAWLSLINRGDGTATLEGTPLNEHVGSHRVTLQVRDAAGGTDTRSFTISVTNVNDAPSFTSTGITAAAQDEAYGYAITTADPDKDDTRTLTAETLPAWLEFEDTGKGAGRLFGTPANRDVGQHDVELRAEDEAGAAAAQSFTITVANVNDAPTFTSMPETEATEEREYVYAVSTTEPDTGDTRTLTAILPVWLSLSDWGDGTGTLEGTPENSHVGTHDIALTVKDSGGARGYQSFIITVSNINDAPRLNADADMALEATEEDVADAVNVGTLISDIIAVREDGDPVTDPDADAVEGMAVISAESDHGVWQYDEERDGMFGDFPEGIAEEGALLLTDTAIIRFVPDENFSGEARITFRAWDRTDGENGDTDADTTDNGGTTAFSEAVATAVVTVSPVNDVPIISGTPPTSVSEDSPYSFTPEAADEEAGGTLTFSVTNKPEWADFDTATGTLTGTPENSHVGTTVGIVISVSDGEETTSLEPFELTVTNVNDAPTISGTPSVSVSEDSQYSFTPETADPDKGDTLSFSVIGKPEWTDFDTGTGTLTGIPENSHVGTTVGIVISVSDGEADASLEPFELTVTNVNDAPTISGTPSVSVSEDSRYSFTPEAADADKGETLAFSVTGKPEWADFDTATGALTGTPENSHVGKFAGIVISVSDGDERASLEPFDLTVTNVNDAPTISGTPSVSVSEDSPYSFTPEADDADKDETLSFSVTGKPEWADFDTATGALTGTPENSHVGKFAGIVISVSDGDERASLEPFELTVTNVNDAPTISGTPSVSVSEDSQYSFTPEAADADKGDTLTFSVTGKPEWADFDTATGALTGTPGNSHVGKFAGIVISVSDGDERASLEPFDLTVINVNDAPTISGTPSVSISEDSQYSFTPEAADADKDETLTFSVTGKPEWADFDTNTGALTGTPENSHVGIFPGIVISVSDGEADASLEPFDLTVVNTNDAPSISGTPPITVDEGAEYTFTPATDDEDAGDILTFSVTNKPDWALFDTTTGALTGTPEISHVGTTADIIISVSDEESAANLPPFEITVVSVNNAPTISGEPPASVNEGSAYTFVPTAGDPDSGDTLTFSVSGPPAWASFDTETGELGGTPGEEHVGTASDIVISVSDGKETASLSPFAITVVRVNDPPVITGQNEISVPEDTALTITLDDLKITDPDNTFPDDFKLTVQEGENYVREEHTVTPAPDFSGTLSIPVKVSDGTDESDLFYLIVTVTEVNEVPVITGQNPLSAPKETPLTITLSDLRVTDSDDLYPVGFRLTVGDGENYDREENTITPMIGFTGTLPIRVTVSDGVNESDPFFLSAEIIEPDHARTISGTITGLGLDREVWVNALSREIEFNQVIKVRGTGEVNVGYTITGLKPASDYQAEISSTDYDYQVYDHQENWENATPVDLSDGDASDIDFALHPGTAAISGRTIFPDGALPGETVRVSVISPSTGSEGSFQVQFESVREVPYSITGLLRADDYIVSVWPDNYRNKYYDGTETGTREREDAKLVSATSARAEAIDFLLDAGASISGTITGSDVAGLRVEAWSEETRSGNAAYTEDNGFYTIEGLEEAPDFRVEVKKAGLPSFFFHEENTVRDRTLATFISTEHGNAEEIDIGLSEGKSIGGIVRDENENPLHMVWIDAWSESRQAGNGLFTGANGVYEIKGLPESDDYRVSAIPDSSEPYMKEEKTGISAGSMDVNFQLKRREEHTLEVVVRDDQGDHIPNVTIDIWSESEQFHGWDMADTLGQQDLHILKPYKIEGLPSADDYDLTIQPPLDSPYSAYSERNISVRSDTVREITLAWGLEISGSAFLVEDDGSRTPVRDVRIIAFSDEKNFRGEAVTNKDGLYDIRNVPEAWDYVITAVSQDYELMEKTKQSPGAGTDFSLTPSGFITGEVRDGTTLNPLKNVRVEAYSEANGEILNFSGIVVTDENGKYHIHGLKKSHHDGTLVSDYRVTVYAEEYLPESQGGKTAGDEVNFSITRGTAGELSGTVTDAEGYPSKAVVDIFEADGDFVQSVATDDNGNFAVANLPSEGEYQLRFTDDFSEQWAGPDDIGFDDPDPDGENNPENAKLYGSGDTVSFRFTEHTGEKTRRTKRSYAADIRDMRSLPPEPTSVSPHITVTWDSSATEGEENYYYLFNGTSDEKITKRNVPSLRPFRSRRVTSEKITANSIPYYFHVAPVNQRGRIGDTEHFEFHVDTVPPSNATVTAPPKTVSRFVNLTTGATGAAEMYLSNTSYGGGGEWEPWVKTREWKVTEGKGSKKIYVQFRDRTKNTANAFVSTEKVAAIQDQYRIAATAGENGAIVPSGDVMVTVGADQTFTIMPAPGYEADNVLINGVSEPLTDGNTYLFPSVTENASIHVTFREITIITHTITADAGENGSLSPSGGVVVKEGDDVIFSMTPDPGYETGSVLVGGNVMTLAPDNQFYFINIREDASISVSFRPKSAKRFSVTASAGRYGTITPPGSVTVNEGEDITFTITSVAGYETDTILVDGEPADLTNGTYSFQNVTADHEIHVTFGKSEF